MYRQVHTSLLSEPWFEALSLPASYLFLYLIIHPLTLPSGFVKLTPRRILRETPLTSEQFDQAKQELCNTKKVCFWSEHFIWWVVHFWEWQGRGPKWAIHVANSLSTLPNFAFSAFTETYPLDTYGMPIGKHPMRINTHGIPINTYAMPTEGDAVLAPAQQQHNNSTAQQQEPPIFPLTKGDLPEAKVKRKTRKERKAELADRERYFKGKFGHLVQH